MFCQILSEKIGHKHLFYLVYFPYVTLVWGNDHAVTPFRIPPTGMDQRVKQAISFVSGIGHGRGLAASSVVFSI